MDNILVIEDEQYISEFISINLERNNFKVLQASSGEDALELLANSGIDLVLLDIKLPGMDGYAVCREIRSKYSKTAIIMVTAKSQDIDKIIGLELGADDYMAKPFNPYELIARIRSVLRRTKAGAEEGEGIINQARFRINIISRKLYKDGNEVKLTPKEFDLIRILASAPDAAFSRDQLLNGVWGRNYFGDTKTLDVHIRRLREKIEDDPDEPAFIETIWGIGYRWRGV